MIYEHNHRALAFYAKEGFREVGRHGYLFGNTPGDDHVLVRIAGVGDDGTDGLGKPAARNADKPRPGLAELARRGFTTMCFGHGPARRARPTGAGGAPL